MKKTLKKSISVILCLVMIFSVFSVSFVSNAAIVDNDNQVMPLYTTIAGYGAAFEVSGLKATASVSLTSQVSTTLKITIYLQKETSSGYETVKTWTKTGTGYALLLEESATINVFYNYRIKATMTAGSETINVFRYE